MNLFTYVNLRLINKCNDVLEDFLLQVLGDEQEDNSADVEDEDESSEVQVLESQCVARVVGAEADDTN